MNLNPFARPEAPAAPGQAYEAQATTTTPRGDPWRHCGLDFPPGAWVDVTEAQAQELRFFGEITTRVKVTDEQI